MMKYSVIIPVYNCAAYLRSCVESFPLERTDLELLLIDDGAADGSGALCDQLAREYACVRVIHQQNGGVSAARNRGIEEAKGKYLLFADSDDTVEGEKLAQLLDAFPQTGADLATFGVLFDYYHKGKPYRSDHLAYSLAGMLLPEAWGRDFAQLYLCNVWSAVWNKVFKKEIIEQYHLSFSTEMFLYEDMEFVLRYLAHCGAIYNDPRGIYHYRQSEDEGNAGRRLKRIDHLPAFMGQLERAMDTLGENVPRAQRQEVLLRLYLVLAREKIGVSDLAGIKRICQDYKQWSGGRELPTIELKFQRRLVEGKALTLILLNKKATLRHKIAVRVKGILQTR